MHTLHFALVGWLMLLVAVSPARSAAAGAVYYVSAPGSDDNPGSRRLPLCSIGAAALRAAAGDLVVVSAGTYREAVVLTRSGAAGAPIVLRGLPGAVLISPDPSASLSAFDIAGDVGFVTIEGFELTGGFAETVFVRPGAHHVELAGLHIHDNRTGIWIAGASEVVVRDSVIDHNHRTGIRIFAGAHHVRVVDTRAEANDDGAGCDGDSDGFNADASSSDLWFERATAAANSEDGFDLQGPNVTLLQAVAQDNGCSGVKIAAGGYLENVLVERSRIGINVSAPSGATTAVQNATLSQNGVGLRASGSGHTLVLRNSIIAGPAKALWVPSGVALREDHNLLYRPSARERLIVRDTASGESLYYGDDVNNGRWRRESGQGVGTVFADAGLQSGSCELNAGSTAIDSGDAVGLAPVDLTGTARPVGAGIDRGAFEWVPVTPTLRMTRAGLRSDGTGNGGVDIRAEMDIPVGEVFDPLSRPVTVALWGTRGDVLRVEIPPHEWIRAPTDAVTLLRMRRAAGAVRVALMVSAGRVTLRLRGRAAALWAADAGALGLTVDVGGVRATTRETQRWAGQGSVKREA